MEEDQNHQPKIEEKQEKKEISFNEERIRSISFAYYSKPEIKKALYEFSQNRETVSRYYESFGKRPDSFQYENDIIGQIKKGATSFHCSEELWSDPLELSTELSKEELNNLKIGWDLVLDIDSKYLDYSKIYAKLLINILKVHGVENIGVKFSGSRGFHIIIPWKSFPEQVYGKKTKDMFPEWPRIICNYLAEIIKPKIAEKIFQQQSVKELAEKTGKKVGDLVVDECISCHRKVIKKYQIAWTCENCKLKLIKIENKKTPKCPNENCRRPLIESSRKEFLFCEFCNLSSLKNPELFVSSSEKTESLIDTDIILVSSRHLFRMPNSLHEKTSLSSVVIDKNEIEKFQINDARPFDLEFKNIEVKNFYPEAKKDEARNLLLQALDWYEQKERLEKLIIDKKPTILKKDLKKIQITNPSEDIFPPQIKLMLEGIKQDGRKRALMVLISFFKSLGIPDSEIEKRIFEWNEKNYKPLRKGYIVSQLNWYKKNARLPPNFNNPIYKDLGVDQPDKLALQTKNPVSYAIKKYFMMRK